MQQPTLKMKSTVDGVIRRRPTAAAAVLGQARLVASRASMPMQVGQNITMRGSLAAAAKTRQAHQPTQVIAKDITDTVADNGPKVAIVHDWFKGGGAELVVEQLHALYPDAPIFTSYCTKEWRERLGGKVRTGFLQYWPFSRLHKYISFLRIWWFTHLDLHGYDLVISSSGAEAKGVHVGPNSLHINYCHAPTHYYWSRYDEYLAHPGFGAFDWLARIGLKVLVEPLRKWDYKAAQRPDYLIANSNHIRAEIHRYYDRASMVIHPPVYIERFRQEKPVKRDGGFVISGRQTPYKRFDLAVVVCTKLNLPLTVIGDGPDHRRLRSLAGPSVTFLGKVSDRVIEAEFARARALIFPGLDDFGITPLEAMAAGTPVIAYRAGGALDYVVPGKTGIFFTEQTAKSLAAALKEFDKQKFVAADIAHAAEAFSRQQFRRKMRLLIKKVSNQN